MAIAATSPDCPQLPGLPEDDRGQACPGALLDALLDGIRSNALAWNLDRWECLRRLQNPVP